MNDTFSTSNLRSTSPFRSMQQKAVGAKQQIQHYRQLENFIGMVQSDKTIEEKVESLFVIGASRRHIDKLRAFVSNMTYDEMYRSYVKHMDYVGDLPGLARLFTYAVKPDYDFADGLKSKNIV